MQLLIVAFLAAAIVGIFGLRSLMGLFVGKPSSEAAEAQASSSPNSFRPTDSQWQSLKLETVKLKTFLNQHTTDGKIANDDDATTPVFSPYSGRVTKLFVKAGDEVKQGQPLLALEATELVQAQNDLISAVATLHTAQAQLNLAQTTEKRQHDLYDSKGAPLKDWQQSQVDLASAEGSSRSAQIAVAAVRNRLRILGKNDADIAAIENAPDALNLSPEATVFAPIGGVVTQRQVGLGQYINSAANGGSSPIFSIGDMMKVWLLANVHEDNAPSMRVGDPVEVHVLAFPSRRFSAKLTYVAVSIDPNTHRLPVRAEVENPDGALKPEMFANFSIIIGKSIDSPAVPEEGVVYEGETARVWIVGKDKTLSVRQIRPGWIQDGMVQALEGVQAGEQVVTSGSLFIDRAARSD
ncbi:MAG: efflux RND transporter periplasmic adaptor subunit [Verrucomicrobia bacterium]|nr:efflux RND transporter periplasmic adaptor subunit [Verrucomicrobiota bacterium]